MMAGAESGAKAAPVMVRLASEGVPVAAIARGTQTPFADVLRALKAAVEDGEIGELPANDWPPGQLRAARAPLIGARRSPASTNAERPDALMRLFDLTRSQALFLDVLLTRAVATREAVHSAVSLKIATDTDPKIIDVHACKIRRKLAPHGVTIETVRGRGFALPKAARGIILARLAAHRDELARSLVDLRTEGTA